MRILLTDKFSQSTTGVYKSYALNSTAQESTDVGRNTLSMVPMKQGG